MKLWSSSYKVGAKFIQSQGEVRMKLRRSSHEVVE